MKRNEDLIWGIGGIVIIVAIIAAIVAIFFWPKGEGHQGSNSETMTISIASNSYDGIVVQKVQSKKGESTARVDGIVTGGKSFVSKDELKKLGISASGEKAQVEGKDGEYYSLKDSAEKAKYDVFWVAGTKEGEPNIIYVAKSVKGAIWIKRNDTWQYAVEKDDTGYYVFSHKEKVHIPMEEVSKTQEIAP